MRSILSSILLFGLIAGMMAFFAPAPVYACSCAGPQPVEAQFNRSEAVFAGRVVEVNEHRSLGGRITKSALFEVNEIWKGGPESQIKIQTGGGGGDCGYSFEQDQAYLVYGQSSDMYGNQKELITIICDRTKLLAQAQEDLAVLGEGRAPTEQVRLDSTQARDWVIVGGIAAAGLILYAVWRKFRASKSSN